MEGREWPNMTSVPDGWPQVENFLGCFVGGWRPDSALWDQEGDVILVGVYRSMVGSSMKLE